MKRMINAILRNYGSTVRVHRDGEAVTVRAFLQPVTSQSWQNMNHMFVSAGEIPRGQYLYIGPTDVPVLGSQYLSLGQKRYLVRRCDTLMVADEDLYLWALCVEGGYDDPWNN